MKTLKFCALVALAVGFIVLGGAVLGVHPLFVLSEAPAKERA